jgi:hypothetical protein
MSSQSEPEGRLREFAVALQKHKAILDDVLPSIPIAGIFVRPERPGHCRTPSSVKKPLSLRRPISTAKSPNSSSPFCHLLIGQVPGVSQGPGVVRVVAATSLEVGPSASSTTAETRQR